MQIDYKLEVDILNYECFLFHFAESKCNVKDFNTLISTTINLSARYTLCPKPIAFGGWVIENYKRQAESLCQDMKDLINKYLCEYDIKDFFTVNCNLFECYVKIVCCSDTIESNFKKFNDLITFAKIANFI